MTRAPDPGLALSYKASAFNSSLPDVSLLTCTPTAAPLVSFVITVHNGGWHLEEAVGSAQGQLYSPIEILVVDDGSTDGTPTILAGLAQYDERIRVHRQEHQGRAAALNAAVKLARGEFVAVLDHDDFAMPERLLHQVPVLLDRAEVAVVGGAAEYMDNSGKPWFSETCPEGTEEVREVLYFASAVIHSAATIRRSVLLDVGGYRPAFTLALDYDLWLRIIEHHEIVNVPGLMVRYRLHTAQGSADVERMALETIAARLSAEARRRGRLDPIPDKILMNDEFAEQLGIRDHELAAEVARYATWYGNTIARTGDPSTAAAILDAAQMRAGMTGDAQLIAEVAAARRAVTTK